MRRRVYDLSHSGYATALSLVWTVFFLSPATAASEPSPSDQAATRWYKGNTHAHSLWSDGNDFPEMIVDWYRQRGYHFLSLSDHNILSDHERWMKVDDVVARAGGQDVMTKYLLRFGKDGIDQREVEGVRQVRLKTLPEFRRLFDQPATFLLIQGEEITDAFEQKPVHINALNLRELIPPPHGDSVRGTMRNILRAVKNQEKSTGQPILAHLNHPNFVWGVTAEDLAHVLEENFFEVYNGHPSINHLGDENHPGDERLWDIANTLRLGELKAPPLFGVATDDSHTYHGRRDVTPGRGWIMVRAEQLAPNALIGAMRKGDFYASTGVILTDVGVSSDGTTLRIDIRPDADARFKTQFIGTLRGYDRRTDVVVGSEGQPLDVTRRYSTDVGKVLATVEGTRAEYRLTGNELYVRATITSTRPADNPSLEGQRKQAWTQPVGWRKALREKTAAKPD